MDLSCRGAVLYAGFVTGRSVDYELCFGRLGWVGHFLLGT